MDWLIEVVKQASITPVLVGTAIVNALMYADDATYLQSAVGAIKGLIRREGIDRAIHGIQALADATERYCGFTGHEIRTNKSA